MIKTDEELKIKIGKVVNSSLAKQLNTMIGVKQYNNVRYFIADEKDNSSIENFKELDIIEDYLIDKIIDNAV